MSTQAVIFDMDGILIDSEPLWQQAELAVFPRLGVPLTAAMCGETLGMRLDASVAHWYERYPWSGPSTEIVAAHLLDKVCELVGSQGVPLPGVYAALDRLQAAGMTLGLASSSPLRLIEIVVDRLQIRDRFQTICTAFDEAHGKPDPAVYLTAAQRLGVAPASCLAIEDSPRGIQAAKAAGMRVVAVPEAASFDQPDFDLADVKLHSLEEFRLEHL